MEKIINSFKSDKIDVIEDNENTAVFAYSDASSTIYYRIQVLDYNAEIEKLKNGDFYHLQIEDTDFYLKESFDDKQTIITLWSDAEKYAAEISCALDKSSFIHTKSADPPSITMPDFSFKAAGAISQFIGFGDYIQGTKEYDFWVKKYYQCMDDHLAVEKRCLVCYWLNVPMEVLN